MRGDAAKRAPLRDQVRGAFVAQIAAAFFDELSPSGTDEEAAEALLHDAVRFGDTIGCPRVRRRPTNSQPVRSRGTLGNRKLR
jgi:hypothetical protein